MDALNKEAVNRLIFALDVPDRQEAERFIKLLDGAVGCFKVGLELFIKEGPDVLKMVKDHSSADIFLDLKLHDIPQTVHRAVTSAASHGVRFITAHCGEGEAMLKAAVQASGQGLEVLAVTVLTSLSQQGLSGLGFRDGLMLNQLVLSRAAQAKGAGCAGVVCSGEEAAVIRKCCGSDLKLVVPAIRPNWSGVDGDDQSRITTPKQAIGNGADLIVVGRPIRDAKNPREAAEKVLAEIGQALQSK